MQSFKSLHWNKVKPAAAWLEIKSTSCTTSGAVPSGKVQGYLRVSQCQSQAEAQDVCEQLHDEQSSGPVESGEAWRELSNRYLAAAAARLYIPVQCTWATCGVGYQRRRSWQCADALCSKTPTMFDVLHPTDFPRQSSHCSDQLSGKCILGQQGFMEFKAPFSPWKSNQYMCIWCPSNQSPLTLLMSPLNIWHNNLKAALF